MGKINILGFDVANLIAAGEVVDRPASVVKELVENAIDAGATKIAIEIQHGGSSLIRVTDNGCGMSQEDLPVAILRHATSKISSAFDLDSISTLGFRGEALAATAAVSKLRILSRTKDAAMGSVLEAEGGENVVLMDSGCAVGTTIMVEELFFNVPARRKFLKKDATETAAVSAVVEKVALSVPHISIKYIADGEIKYLTSGNGSLESTIFSLYGRECAKRLIPIDRTDHGVRVSGFISEADFVRSNRNMENFFINGRFVKSRTAMAAVEQAYLSKMQADKFPFCVLNLEMNPAVVDVNVHPSKLEVKFSNEKDIFDAIYYAVLSGLESSTSRPELSFTGQTTPKIQAEIPKAAETKNAFVTGEEAKKLYQSFVPVDDKKGTSFKKKDQLTLNTDWVKEILKKTEPMPTPAPKTAPVAKEPSKKETTTSNEAPTEKTQKESTLQEKVPMATEAAPIPEYQILGEAYNCYVILQMEDRLLLVDKHAAHERILFDRLCRNMKTKEKHSQILLYPLEVTMTTEEKEALNQFESEIKGLGYAFKASGEKVLVSEIPDDMSREQAEEMLVTFAGRCAEGYGNVDALRTEFVEKALWQAACKAAIKGGRVYGTEHLRWICDQLLQAPDKNGSVIKTCPHGRPVAFEIKKSSIERQFARIQ